MSSFFRIFAILAECKITKHQTIIQSITSKMCKITARIPNNNVEERKYIISVLFADFLHAEPPLIEVAETDCTTLLFGEKKIIFRDHFWNAHHEPLSYLSTDNLPHPTLCSNQFAPDNDIVVLFGDEALEISEDTITCGIDIWASAFFMLTRWEEYVCPTRDEHGRFPAKASIALKNNFLHRPIVNEYVEMLRGMMKHLCNDFPTQNTNPQLIPTHDIDILQANCRLKSFAGDLLKRHDLKMALSRFGDPRDVYDTFDFLMDKSEDACTKSIFFFMASDHREGYSGNYLNTKKFAQTIEKIKKRGHDIGFHAGHGTADNPQRYAEELQLLRQHTGIDIKYSRQHFLKFDIPHTFNILENNGITHDFSLGYSDCEGYRCGTGNNYQVFDFRNRKTLNVREVPLIIMDSTLNIAKHLPATEASELITSHIELGRKHKMPITILFHNSSFDTYQWNGWKQLYSNIIDNIATQS